MKIYTCRVKHGAQYGWGLRVGQSCCPTLSLCTTEGNAAALGKYLHPKHEIVMMSVHKDQSVYDSAVPHYRGWPESLGVGTPSKTSEAEWLARAPEVIDGRTVFKEGSGTFMPDGAVWKQGKDTWVQAPPIAYTPPAQPWGTVIATQPPTEVRLTLAQRKALREAA